MQWHYAKNGEQFGPVDDEELRRLAQQGQITPSDLIWNPSLGDKWVAASLLCLLTLGIGYLWLGPYMQASMAHFYEDVKPRAA